jgi:hypothetical protein
MALVEWPALFAEGSKVVEILRPGRGTLVAQQVGKIDHEQGDVKIRAQDPQGKRI